MSKIRWGIIGTGKIAHKFARGLLRSETGQLAAVASRTQAKADEFAREFETPHAFGSYEELLAAPDIDVVYIATPHPQHKAWTIRAAHAGKHILCEKPLGLHYDEAVEMLQAVWENSVFFMEGYMYRCHPQIDRMLQLIRDGAIGEIRTINARFSFSATYDLAGRLFNRTLGGGAILDVGGYCTSMARLIAGATTGAVMEPERVFAVGQIGPESGVDEFAVALLQFPGGVVAQLSCGLRLQQDNRVVIEGTEGTLTLPTPWVATVDGGEAYLHLQKNGRAPEIITVTAGPLFALEADLVAHHLAQGHLEAAWPAMTWADTLANMRVQDKWRRAMDAVAPSFAEKAGTKTQPITFSTWEQRFTRLFLSSVDKHRTGHHKASGLVDDKSRQFLASIGHTEQEFFDFVEDYAKSGEPTPEQALRIAAVRRDYFLQVQNGHFTLGHILMESLPPKDAAIDGVPWLPRLIQKALAKLRGEMPPDLMYGCGGDRRFFRTHGLDGADFLHHVWQSDGDETKIVAWVQAQQPK